MVSESSVVIVDVLDVGEMAFDRARQLSLQNGKAGGVLLVSSGEYRPTVVRGGTNHELATGCWAPKAHRCAKATAIPSGLN